MKKIGKVLLAIICLFALSTKVKAIYNGQGSVGYPSGGSTGASNCGSNICTYSNHEHGPIIKAQLYYVNNGNFTPQGDPVYYMGSTYKSSANGTVKEANQAYINSFGNQITIMNELNGLYYGDFKSASNILRSYFGDNDNSDITNLPNANLVAFFNRAYGTSGNGYQERMNQETQVANREAAASYGYRLIFEPALTFSNANKLNSSLPKRTILTPIEIKQFYDEASSKPAFSMCHAPIAIDKPSCSTPVSERRFGAIYQISFLHTEFKDVGVDGASEEKCQITYWNNFSKNSGCAMNIIDVGKKLQPHYCYDRTISGDVQCTNVDGLNVGDFYEEYTERECTAKEDAEDDDTKYGKLVKSSGNCSLYARETGRVMLPGNVSKNNTIYDVTRGAYVAWPARSTSAGLQATISDTVEFTMVGKAGACSQAEINDLKDAAVSKVKTGIFALKLKGGNFELIDEDLIPVTAEENLTIGTIAFNGNVSNKFKLNKVSYMQINEVKNRIYDRLLNKVYHRSYTTNTNEYNRGEGVVSLAVDNTKASEVTKSTVELYNLRFGIDSGGTFGREVRNYKCELEFKRPPCECPPGQISKSLEFLVANGYTCAQAMNYAEEQNLCRDFCPLSDGTKYDITDCVVKYEAKGYDFDTAHKMCTDAEPACNKTCTTEAGVDIPVKQYSACVTDYMTNHGYTRTEAENRCDDRLCGCVVNGVTPSNYLSCLDQGGTRNYCTFAFCDKQNVCKQCLYCTVGCKVRKENINGQVAVVKRCDNQKPTESDCGHRAITNSCILEKAGVNSVEELASALDSGKITFNALDDYIYECNLKESKNTGELENVVFRLIDLDNPFPGPNGTGRLTTGNFDSDQTIKEVITEARGAKGDALYNKTPLYTITVTPTQARAIREYNKLHPLSDFNLTCVDGTNYCVSDFLHNSEYRDKYITISTDTLKSACVNIKTNDANSFKKCYEENN